MRVLVLGAQGMLGHRAWAAFVEAGHEAHGAVRALSPAARAWAPFAGAAPGRLHEGVDATRSATVAALLERLRPALVVNCVGVVKQLAAAKEAVPSITLNALWPHQLAELCAEVGARLFHLSTDCVFSGARGHYAEDDPADAADLYGRSKLLGEVAGQAHALTLRTSMVGWELQRGTGLLEWFAGRRGQAVRGYERVRFSGLSTPALARALVHLAERAPDLHGLYHLAAPPIAKAELLRHLNAALGWGVHIEPDFAADGDRTLDDRRLRAAVPNLPSPGWAEMVAELAALWPSYAAGRAGDQ